MIDQNLPVLTSQTYVKETAIALWDKLPTVILSGFLFTLVSLPALIIFLMNLTGPAILIGIVTAGPGWLAMCGLIARALSCESTSIVDFFRAFAHFFMRGILLGAFFALPLVSTIWLLPSLLNPSVPTMIWVGLAADVAGIFLLSALSLYTHPQIVLCDVSVIVALRNSLLLAPRYLNNTLGLLGMAVLLVLLSVNVSYFLLVILPACWLVFVINNCHLVLQIELGKSTRPDNPQAPE